MTYPTITSTPAIGACLSCRQLYLITPDTDRCLLCGRPPSHMLPFGLATPVDMTLEPPAPEPAPEPATPTETVLVCPCCDQFVWLVVTETEVFLRPHEGTILAEEEPTQPVGAPLAAPPDTEEAEAAAAAATPPRTDQPAEEVP